MTTFEIKNRNSIELEVLLGSLPGEVGIDSAEVAVFSSLLINRSSQVKFLDDVSRSEVEVVSHDSFQVFVLSSSLGSSIRIDVHGEGVGKTNSVGDLDENSAGELIGDQGLGDVTSVVSSRSVDLGGVFSREGTSSMGSPASVGIYNNLSASKSSVSLGSSHHEAARGVDDDLGILQELSGADFLNDLFSKNLVDFFVGDSSIVLSGDEDVVDSDGLDLNSISGIFNNDLGFAVGSQPGDLLGVSSSADLFADLVGQVVAVGVEDLLVPFISGIAEHESLISSSELILGLFLMDGCSDFLALSFNVNNHAHVLVVDTLVLVVISNFLHNVPSDLFVLDSFSLHGSLTKQADLLIILIKIDKKIYHFGLGGSFQSNDGVGISLNTCIKYSV